MEPPTVYVTHRVRCGVPLGYRGMTAARVVAMRSLLAACLVMSACGVSPTPAVQPNTAVVNQGSGDDGSGERINGDVNCNGGSFVLPAGSIINGNLDASDCTLEVSGVVNGTITATGAADVVVSGARADGGIDIEQSGIVVVENSELNGDGTFIADGTLSVVDNVFNGSLTIDFADSGSDTGSDSGSDTDSNSGSDTGSGSGSDPGSAACSVAGNDVNGSLSVMDCP
jgi:hypothetical protein